MADKRIDELIAATEMSDSALLVVYQDGETKSLSGGKVRGYAESAAQDEIGEKFSSMTIVTGEPDTNASYDPATNTMTIPRGKQGAAGSGSGDMIASTYDPQGKAQDVFAYVDNALSAFEAPSTLVKLFDRKLTEETEELVIDLSGVDLSRYLKLQLQGTLPGADGDYICRLFFNGDEASGDYGYNYYEFDPTGQTSNIEGTVSDASRVEIGEAFDYSGGSFFDESIYDCGDCVACLPCGGASHLVDGKAGLLVSRQNRYLWRNGGLADVKTLTLRYQYITAGRASVLPAGARFLLTGWKM